MKDEPNTYMRSGTRPSPEGRRWLFAGGTVSSIMCPADGQQKDDRKGQAGQDEGRGKAEKSTSKPQRGGGFSLNLDLPGVSR